MRMHISTADTRTYIHTCTSQEPESLVHGNKDNQKVSLQQPIPLGNTANNVKRVFNRCPSASQGVVATARPTRDMANNVKRVLNYCPSASQ